MFSDLNKSKGIITKCLYSHISLMNTILRLDRSLDIDDLISEVLLRCVNKSMYPSKKTVFFILSELIDGMNRAKNKIECSHSEYDDELPVETSSEEDNLVLRIAIKDILNEYEFNIIDCKYYQSMTNHEIADTLNISEKSVRRQLKRILSKLEIKLKD